MDCRCLGCSCALLSTPPSALAAVGDLLLLPYPAMGLNFVFREVVASSCQRSAGQNNNPPPTTRHCKNPFTPA